MVLSSGTLVKSGVTTNETISYPRGTLPTFTFCVFVLMMVCSEVPNDDSNFVKYFIVWYVVVPIFDTVEQNGTSSTGWLKVYAF